MIRRKRSTGISTLNETHFVLKDYLDPTAIIDPTGTVMERYRYDAFGPVKILTPNFSARNTSECAWNFLFHAEFLDEDSGLYNYGYRVYHPELGRWPSRDPIREGGGINLYDFIWNQAANRSDYLGLVIQDKRGRSSVPPGNLGPGPYTPPRIDEVWILPPRRPFPELPTGQGPNPCWDSGGTRPLPPITQSPPWVHPSPPRGTPTSPPRSGSPWIEDPWKPWEPLTPMNPPGTKPGIQPVVGVIGAIVEVATFADSPIKLQSLIGHIEFIANWDGIGKNEIRSQNVNGCGCLVVDFLESMSLTGGIVGPWWGPPRMFPPGGHPIGLASLPQFEFYPNKSCESVSHQPQPILFDPTIIRRRTLMKKVCL